MSGNIRDEFIELDDILTRLRSLTGTLNSGPDQHASLSSHTEADSCNDVAVSALPESSSETDDDEFMVLRRRGSSFGGSWASSSFHRFMENASKDELHLDVPLCNNDDQSSINSTFYIESKASSTSFDQEDVRDTVSPVTGILALDALEADWSHFYAVLQWQTDLNVNVLLSIAGCDNFFQLACRGPRTPGLVAELLKRGAIVGYRNIVDGKSPIHLAAESLNVEALRELVQCRKIQVNSRDNAGNTALHLLASCRHSPALQQCLRILLNDDRVELNGTNLHGETAILIAARLRRKMTVKLILAKAISTKRRIDLDLGMTSAGQTAYDFINGKYAIEGITFNRKDHAILNKLYSSLISGDIAVFEELLGQYRMRQLTDFTYTLLQVAVFRGSATAVKSLLDAGMKFTMTPNRRTVFHLLVIGKVSYPGDHNEHTDCLQLLLKYVSEIDINAVDDFGVSALHLAAINGDFEILETLLSIGACMRPTYQGQNELQLTILGSHQKNAFAVGHKRCFDILLAKSSVQQINASDNFGYTALYRAAEAGNIYYLRSLLEHGARLAETGGTVMNLIIACASCRSESARKYNECFDLLLENLDKFGKCAEEPLLLAASVGNPYFLKRLIDNGAKFTLSNMKETPLQLVVTQAFYKPNAASNYRSCLDIILKKTAKFDLNNRDVEGNTALHVAVRNNDRYMMKELLKRGAQMTIENLKGEKPLDNIHFSFMEEYLTSCLSYKRYSVKQKKRCLVIDNTPFLRPDSSGQKTHDWMLLRNLSENRDLKHLLKHPLCTTVLHLKWDIVSTVFYFNFGLYLIFSILMTAYLFAYYSPLEHINMIHDMNVSTVYCKGDEGIPMKYTNLFLLVLLTVREAAQILLSPWHYIKSIDNWVELPLLISSYVILFVCVESSMKRILSAINILLLWGGFVLLEGRFLPFASYIEMLKTVTLTLAKSLALYSGLIIGFSMGFYFLFHVNVESSNTFYNPGLAIFKTLLMMTGEFDTGDNLFGTMALGNSSRVEDERYCFGYVHFISYTMFALFVLLVVIALFNLLLGLAVRDTSVIKDNADMVAFASRIRVISSIEDVVPNYPFCLPRCITIFTCKWISKLETLKRIMESDSILMFLSSDERESVLTDASGCNEYRTSPSVYKDASKFMSKITGTGYTLKDVSNIEYMLFRRLRSLEDIVFGMRKAQQK